MTDMLEAVAKQLKRRGSEVKGLEDLWRRLDAATDRGGSGEVTQEIKKAWAAQSDRLDQAVENIKKLL